MSEDKNKVDLSTVEGMQKFADSLETAATKLGKLDEMQATINGLTDEKAELAERVEKAEALLAELKVAKEDKVEEVKRTLPKRADELDAEEKALREKLSPMRFFRAVAKAGNVGDNKNAFDELDAGLEYELSMEARKKYIARHKALGTTANVGGYLMPELWNGDFVGGLYANLVVKALGARVSTDFVDREIHLPTLATSATALWYAEGDTISESNPTFGDRPFTPHKVATIIPFNNEALRRRSVPSLEGEVMTDLGAVVARALDYAALKGAGGTSDEPLGILTESISDVAAPTTSGAVGVLDYATIIRMIMTVAGNDALEGNLGWACHPLVLEQIMKILDTQGRPLFMNPTVALSGGTGRIPGTIFAYPVAMSTQLDDGTSTTAAGELLFGNFRDVHLGFWGSPMFMGSEHAAFAADGFKLRVIQEADVVVRRVASFVKCDDIDTN